MVTLKQVRKSKSGLVFLLNNLIPGLNPAIGINGNIGKGYGFKVNIPLTLERNLPDEYNSVPLNYEVVGGIKKRVEIDREKISNRRKAGDYVFLWLMQNGVKAYKELEVELQYQVLSLAPPPGWMIGKLERDLNWAVLSSKEEKNLRGYVPTELQNLPNKYEVEAGIARMELDDAKKFEKIYREILTFTQKSPNESLRKLAEDCFALVAPVVFK